MGRHTAGTIERLSSACNRYAEWFLLLLGITMTATVILQVFCRYVLNHSLFWSEELARYLLVWLTFIGATVAYHRSMHPGVDVIFKRLERKNRYRIKRLVHLVSLIFFLVMIWYGCSFAYFIRVQTTPALSLPKWLIFAIIPLSGLIFTLHGVAFLWRKPQDPPSSGGRP
ncbi:MAG: TRAP transporter small permease [Desulfofustis sp.]|jgi:TRAP-type C4-dicarboxylate transport system permease small subunit